MSDTEQEPPVAQELIPAFFVEISIIEQLARTQLERILPEGMREPHYGVLNHMIRLGLKSESPAALASAFQVTRPTMTNTIQKLEAQGFVTIEPDPQDGRGKRVLVTEAGRAARDEALAKITPLFAKLAEDLGMDLFQNTKPGLERLRAYMDANRDIKP